MYESRANAIVKGVLMGAATVATLALGYYGGRAVSDLPQAISESFESMIATPRNERIETLLEKVQCEYTGGHGSGRREFIRETLSEGAMSDLDAWFLDVNAHTLTPEGNLSPMREYWRMVDAKIADDPSYAGRLHPCPRPSFLVATE